VIRAVVFDMDGVISDTERLHVESEAVLLSRYGLEADAVLGDGRYVGVPDRQFFSEVFATHGVTADVDAAIAEKWALMARCPDAAIVPIPGALELIAALRRRGVSLALASSSPRRFIERVLRCLGLAQAFDVVVSADDVTRGKPAPDIFLAVAERLGVPPSACVVIEDSGNGMLAARRAGMTVVGLVRAPGAWEADHLVTDLRRLTPETLVSLGAIRP
jgi:HAD superfamily hydrolase (TIGR01509 family)